MEHILKEGDIELLVTEAGGLSGEVHLVKHKGKKYILRKCEDLAKAKSYCLIYSKFKKYKFLPKLLGRFGKDVLFEYIKGRELKRNERLYVFEQLGKICGYVNKIKVKDDPDKRFNRLLNELVTGKFKYSEKVFLKRKKTKVRKKPKAIFSKEKAGELKKGYNYLKKKAKPVMALDANDLSPSNFKLYKKKVYFVDIEAIKPKIKGFCTGKCFLSWAKTKKQQEAFKKGYNHVNPIKFLTPYYQNFIFLNFILQRVNYRVNVFQDDGYGKYLKMLDNLIERYKNG